MSKLRDWFSVNLVLASLPGLLSVAMWLLSALFVILLLYLKCPVCIIFTLRGGGDGGGERKLAPFLFFGLWLVYCLSWFLCSSSRYRCKVNSEIVSHPRLLLYLFLSADHFNAVTLL